MISLLIIYTTESSDDYSTRQFGDNAFKVQK